MISKLQKINKSNNRQGGQVMMLTVVFFLVIGLIVISGISFTALRDISNMRSLLSGRVSYYVSEAGIEDSLYRIKKGIAVLNNTITIDGNYSQITVSNDNGIVTLTSQATTSDFYKRIQIGAVLGTGIGFHYAVQAGNGGFLLDQSSSITGNVYSDGPVIGSGNYIYGDVVSSGATGTVYGIHATGTVYSHTIGGSAATIIDKNAYYYQTITNTTVTGTRYPNSADLGTTSLPISDQQITKWENDALVGGVMSSDDCDNYNANNNICTISTDRTIGPKKIPFNLTVKDSGKTLTIAGPIWVTGNITFSTQPIIKMDASLGSQNVPLIADNPSNRLTSSIVTVEQGAEFQGSGSAGSFVFIISQNNSAETGGSIAAITLQQGASALVVYASHGLIDLTQSVGVKEITAYKISLSNTANVTYDKGLPSTIFSSGPTGGYSTTAWGEI